MATSFIVFGESTCRYGLPFLHVRATARGTDEKNVAMIFIDELEKLAMVLRGARIKYSAKMLVTSNTSAHSREHLRRDAGQLPVALGDNQVKKSARVSAESKGDFLDAHVLVTDGVKTLGDEKLPREASNGVLVNADGDTGSSVERWPREPHELRD
jgi:hypothetical protein